MPTQDDLQVHVDLEAFGLDSWREKLMGLFTQPANKTRAKQCRKIPCPPRPQRDKHARHTRKVQMLNRKKQVEVPVLKPVPSGSEYHQRCRRRAGH